MKLKYLLVSFLFIEIIIIIMTRQMMHLSKMKMNLELALLNKFTELIIRGEKPAWYTTENIGMDSVYQITLHEHSEITAIRESFRANPST